MVIFKIAILFSYLHISALATTDIMRLLKGSDTSVFDSSCYCSACGHKIALIYQFPIIAFLLNKGKCPYCKTKIEPLNFWLEVVFFALYTVIMVVFAFKPIGVLVSFALYEIIKIVFIMVKGRKKNYFFREYFLSLFTNTIVFSLVGFLSVLYNFVVNGNIFT